MNKKSACFLGVCLMLLSGCFGGTSAPSHFYTLSEEGNLEAKSTFKTSIGVLPVLVPEYLDKPQIVLTETKDQMRVSETERWVEPLSVLAQRVLIRDLQQIMPQAYVKTKEYNNAQFRRILRVEIDQMTGSFETKRAQLSLWWAVLDTDGNEIYRNRFSATASMGSSYESYVQAQSGLWSQAAGQMGDYLSKR